MRLGHLVLDQILPDLNDELREPQVVEIHVGRLEPVNIRMPRRLISAPRIFVPIPSSESRLGGNSTQVMVQETQQIRKPINAELTDKPVDRQIGTELHRPCAGSSHLFDHQRFVAIPQQPAFPVVAAVRSGNCLDSGRGVAKDFAPRQADKRVISAIVKFVFRSQLGIVRQRREAGVGPLFPAPADDRPSETVGAVNPPLHRVSLGTAARIPGLRRPVSVEIAITVVVVILLAADHDAVAEEGSHAAHVGVVGCADPCKRSVVAILIEKDLFPIAVRISAQRIGHTHRREGPRLGPSSQQTAAGSQATFQELSP